MQRRMPGCWPRHRAIARADDPQVEAAWKTKRDKCTRPQRVATQSTGCSADLLVFCRLLRARASCAAVRRVPERRLQLRVSAPRHITRHHTLSVSAQSCRQGCCALMRARRAPQSLPRCASLTRGRHGHELLRKRSNGRKDTSAKHKQTDIVLSPSERYIAPRPRRGGTVARRFRNIRLATISTCSTRSSCARCARQGAQLHTRRMFSWSTLARGLAAAPRYPL